MKKLEIELMQMGMIAISFVMCFTFVSCDNNDDNLRAILLDNKWIMRDYSYGEGNDDHVWVDEESTTLYFNTESSGFEYWLQKDYDSDLGNSINKSYVLFDYEVSGNRVQITNEKGYNSTLYYREGLLTNENGDLFYMPSPLNSDDMEFMAGIGPKEGKCGDNLTYSYDDRTRQLTISGTGKMYDYPDVDQPWKDFYVEDLVIEEGCTYIGANAFYNVKYIFNLYLPNSLEEIGVCAFCDAMISSLTIPQNTKIISTYAFGDCEYLKELHFDNNSQLEIIDYGAFCSCPIKQTSLTLPDNVKEVGNYAFSISHFSKVYLNEGLETIGCNAFGFIDSRTSINIPNSVKTIGTFAFYGPITEIRLGTGIQSIVPYAFYTTVKSGILYANLGIPTGFPGETRPIVSYDSDSNPGNWTLYVPKGSKTIYQEHPMWKSFKYIYEDNTLTSGNGYPGEGTLSNPFTPLGAASIGNSLAEDEKTEKTYYVKGKISRIKYSYSEEYGTAAFWISENGDTTDEFYVYGCYYFWYLPWKSYNNQIYEGDDVVVSGKITNYKGIPEMATKENCMYSHNGRTY